jgi:hypothetical protein
VLNRPKIKKCRVTARDALRMVWWIWKIMAARHSMLRKHHFALFCTIPCQHLLFCRPLQHPSPLETDQEYNTIRYDMISL